MANPGAWVFGATLLHDGVQRNWFARKIMDRNDSRGICTNGNDSLEGLRSAMSSRFADSSVEVVGCVGIFAGKVRWTTESTGSPTQGTSTPTRGRKSRGHE